MFYTTPATTAVHKGLGDIVSSCATWCVCITAHSPPTHTAANSEIYIYDDKGFVSIAVWKWAGHGLSRGVCCMLWFFVFHYSSSMSGPKITWDTQTGRYDPGNTSRRHEPHAASLPGRRTEQTPHSPPPYPCVGVWFSSKNVPFHQKGGFGWRRRTIGWVVQSFHYKTFRSIVLCAFTVAVVYNEIDVHQTGVRHSLLHRPIERAFCSTRSSSDDVKKTVNLEAKIIDTHSQPACSPKNLL